MPRPPVIAAVLVTALALAACGDDDTAQTGTRAAATAPAATADRYCALTREMDAAGTRFFARLELDENATAKQFERAERRFVQRFAPQFAEIERAAPAEIRADVRLLLAGQRVRAGLEPAGSVDAAAVGAAEERVKAYEKRGCAKP